MPRLGAFPNLRLINSTWRKALPPLITNRSPAAPLAGGALAFMDASGRRLRSSPARWSPSRPRPASEGPATDLLDGALSPRGIPDRPAAGLARARQPARLPRAAGAGVLDPRRLRAAVRPALRGRGRPSAAGEAATPRGSRPRWWPRRSGWRPPGERRIGLLFLVGEENGSDGARVAADLEPRGRFLVNGEPTENRLSIGQKGSLRVDLQATGRAAHSAYPDEGAERHRRAARHHRADPAHAAADRSRCSARRPSTSGSSSGGVAPNVLAPEASAQILIRTVEPTDGLKAAIQRPGRAGRVGRRFRSSCRATRAGPRRPAGRRPS